MHFGPQSKNGSRKEDRSFIFEKRECNFCAAFLSSFCQCSLSVMLWAQPIFHAREEDFLSVNSRFVFFVPCQELLAVVSLF